MKILFLINNAFGIGGTIQTTFNLGGALAERGHEVEVLSTFRARDVPRLWADPRIRLMALTEKRPAHPDHDGHAPGRGEPPALYPRSDYRSGDYDRYVEERYRRYLAGSDADVVIATRPGLIVYAAQLAPRQMIRIGQEHLTRDRHRKKLRWLMPQHIRKLDAFVTVSERDAEDYRRHLRLWRTKLLHIPNSVPAPRVPPSHGRAKLVVAAGRLVASKRYDVLIRAFARVVAERPDWGLRLYGDGEQRDTLRALVHELGLHNHVRLMGGYSPLETEWAKGSIAAVSADQEPFGMTLVEAMRAGLPVVSTDAPYGPGEILTDGVDGLLTPVGDPDALGGALLRVINDDAGRREMAARALEHSQRYDPGPIAERYEQLFDDLRKRTWGWRRRREPMTVLGPAPTLTMPTADCVVGDDGRVRLQGAPDGARWHHASTGEVAGDTVPAGSWQLRAGDVTVRAGRRDTRALLEMPDATRVELPFQRGDGGLGLRVVDAPALAELDAIRADDAGVHLTVRLVGTKSDGPTLLAVEKNGQKRHITIAHGEATISDLAAGNWALWVRPRPDDTPIRLAKLADDIVEKRVAYVLPATPTLKPYFTPANELMITSSR